jgi:hypothetical protein
MSPFNYAHKINEPILLIHGEADNNSGTFPIQSERMYMALKGHGATVRYVTLPARIARLRGARVEHARRSPTLNWLDKYVKNSLEAGDPVTLPKTESIADGLMPVRPGDLTFAHARVRRRGRHRRRRADHPDAVLWLFTKAKIVAEPHPAPATVAAALGGKVSSTGPIVAIVSGGNISLERLEELRAELRRQRSYEHAEIFEMERMQSTWENLVDFDMSESGVRP